MPFDPNERRREQYAFHGQQFDRRQRDATSRETAAVCQCMLNCGVPMNVQGENQVLGIVSTSIAEVKERQTPVACDLFREHVGKLVGYLDFLWHDMLPAELTDRWRSQIALLDSDKSSQSLEILLALRDSYRQARTAYQPHPADLSQAVRFEQKVPRIGQQIDALIVMLK